MTWISFNKKNSRTDFLSDAFFPYNRIFDSLSLNQVTNILGLNETENEYSSEVDLAGFKKDEVTVNASSDGVVEISADSPTRGKFYHAFYMGDIDIDNIKVTLVDGVLSLKVPKHEKRLKKKLKIE